jgi:nitrite reductase/ring-hydroxylating ferredoxin subunit
MPLHKSHFALLDSGSSRDPDRGIEARLRTFLVEEVETMIWIC